MNKSRSHNESPSPFVERTLNLPKLLAKKSHFLFGPRQTGKTSLIRHAMKNVKVYDLLDTSVYVALSHHPGRLGQEITDRDRVVIIDEIQRLPELLNEVHRLIEERGVHFLLTGSSSRKLRRGGVNLLGGRARTRYLHPFTWKELGERFDWLRLSNEASFPRYTFQMIRRRTSPPTQELICAKKSWRKA